MIPAQAHLDERFKAFTNLPEDEYESILAVPILSSRPWPAAAPAGQSPAPPPPDAAGGTVLSGPVLRILFPRPRTAGGAPRNRGTREPRAFRDTARV